MKTYNHKEIEKKWQDKWEEAGVHKAEDNSQKPKYYALVEFPYPSGDGLHVGHPRPYIGLDLVARKRRMQGFNVLYPMGFDAFGLPTENYAIKTGEQPEVVTQKNCDNFRRQIKMLGTSFDWSREINTTDPKYYKWTQWLFLQFLKHDLAYKTKIKINWCPKDKIGLANEEVVNGCCERCGTPVEKREKEQWMLRITKYADRLDKDLGTVNYLEKIKLAQRNWIGKSEGTEIEFEIKNNENKIKVFTTRVDTLFGVTYVVVAPEHPIIENLKLKIENWDEVEKYIKETKNKTEIERAADEKEKTGVRLEGVTAINPVNKEEVPIFVADYVLGNYGTGAVMAVPAHDDRDFEFAKKYNLPIKEVISGGDISKIAFVGEGQLVNSGEFDNLTSEIAREKITEKFGQKVTKFKLRDWVFSRQRYWGEPIPVVHCEKCGIVPLKEEDLPLELPKVKNYRPTDNGDSPLATISDWVNTKCPLCGGPAKRETDTMPNWAGSSWYFLRYIDPQNNKVFADAEKLKYWMPIDWYNGGMEHTTLHLLYSRFWNKFFYDIGLSPVSEPYQKRTSHGFILGSDGEKMSKSRGNVVNPDNVIDLHGADTMRLYEMFMGPFDQMIAWSDNNIIGVRRFIERVWKLQTKVSTKATNPDKKFQALLHKTIKKIGDDIESMSFNTAVSAMMILVNEMEKMITIPQADFEVFLTIMSPFAPHITEELWQGLGHGNLLVIQKWPEFDESKIKEEGATFMVQINGKIRAQFEAENGISETEAKQKALGLPEIQKWLAGQAIKKIIFVPNKIVNFVV